ncbi:MAG TPA: hypothetical protein VHU41_01655, partial [Thermoanaerobaculia bacterium]|nr:hypothetical protein [Thermoanaerobaculia bacterium]
MTDGESQALALDLAAASGAYDRVSDLMRTVMTYKTGLDNLDLSPAQVFGGTFDPFEKLPGLRQALAAARATANGWGNVGTNLWMAIFMGTHEMSAYLSATAAETRRIVDGATAAKRPLTQAEIDSITRALQRMQGLLQGQRDKIDGARREAADFVRLISGDYAKLTTSAERLDGAIAWIDNWVVTVLPSYMRDIHMMNMAAEYAAAWRRK